MKKVFLASTVILIVLSIFFEFYQAENAGLIMGFLAMIMIFSGLTFAKRFTTILSSLVLLLSFGLGIFYKIDLGLILEGVETNIPIAVLFLTVPFISIPTNRGGYLEAANFYFKKFSNSPNKFFSIVTGMVFSVGSVTNLASVRIVNDILSGSFLPKKFLIRSYGAGFAGCMAWSPYFAGISLAVTYAGLTFTEFFPYGLFYSFLVMLLGLLIFSFDSDTKAELQESLKSLKVDEGITERKAKKKMYTLIVNFVLLLLIVMVGERIFSFSNIMYLVTIVSMVYGLIWLFLVAPPTVFLGDILSHRFKILQTVSEVVFFLSVGILARAISLTSVQDVIRSAFLKTAEFHPVLMVEIIILSIAVFAIFGIHQLVSITIIGTSLPPEVLGLSPIAYSLMFAAAWSLSALSSPFVPFNMVLSEVVDKSTFEIAFRYNTIYTTSILLLAGAYIMLIIQFI